MVGTIRLSGNDYRWVYGVRASYIYQTLFGKIQEETDSLKAFEVNVKFLYSCIKASDELRLIDGQETELNDMKIGEFEVLIYKEKNEQALADFLIQIAENNGLLKKQYRDWERSEERRVGKEC